MSREHILNWRQLVVLNEARKYVESAYYDLTGIYGMYDNITFQNWQTIYRSLSGKGTLIESYFG